jgi:recombinational DNA repair protein (RecF pathway)
MASIKLANMEYASELSAQLLEHAQQLEKLYQDLSKAITDNADDKSLRKLVSKSLKLEEFGIKAQVRIAHQKKRSSPVYNLVCNEKKFEKHAT